jgi:hypothetical protein
MSQQFKRKRTWEIEKMDELEDAGGGLPRYRGE